MYRLDVVGWTLTRFRGAEPARAAVWRSHLRRDGQAVRLVRVVLFAVGLPAVFDLEPLGGADTVLTWRTTTRVARIDTWPNEPALAPGDGHEPGPGRR